MFKALAMNPTGGQSYFLFAADSLDELMLKLYMSNPEPLLGQDDRLVVCEYDPDEKVWQHKFDKPMPELKNRKFKPGQEYI